MGPLMPARVRPEYFNVGNAFLGGVDQAHEGQRRNALLDLERQQYGLQERRQNLGEQEYQRGLEAEAVAGQQLQHQQEIWARLFEENGLPGELAQTEGADELAAELLAQKVAPPEQPKLIADYTGRLVPEAEGVRPWREPKAPQGPGQLYQVVGPDGNPRFVTAEEARGQQPFNKSEKPPVVADPAAQVQDAENVLAAINTAKGLISWNTTGFTGQKLGEIGGTDAYNLRSALDTVKASIGFDRLQRMREESKTGGALGQVAVRELDLLQATIASLDANQSGPQLKTNLGRVETQYEKAMKAYEAALSGGADQPTRPGQVAVIDFSELPD